MTDTPPPMQSLLLLMQREQQQCDQAQSALRRAEDATRRANEQAEQLRAYRSDYEARWSAQFHQGGTMEIMHCYRSFMQRLDEAVTLQSRQAEVAAAMCEDARRVLLECERRVASVRKLMERRSADARQAGRQHEQKHNDDLAQRIHWRNVQRDGPIPQ